MNRREKGLGRIGFKVQSLGFRVSGSGFRPTPCAAWGGVLCWLLNLSFASQILTALPLSAPNKACSLNS